MSLATDFLIILTEEKRLLKVRAYDLITLYGFINNFIYST